MIKPKSLPSQIVSLLSDRLHDEYTASYFYRGASNWCKNAAFFKAAEYYLNESIDELRHARILEDFMTDWNVIPDLRKLSAPAVQFAGLDSVIDAQYNLEYELYEAYESTSVTIFESGDICAFDVLTQLRDIQMKSVAEVSDMLNMLEGVNVSDKFQMVLLEKKLYK